MGMAVTSDHRYHAAFDAISALPADLVLDERYHPGAGAALTDWAYQHRKFVAQRDVIGWPSGMLSVSVGMPGTTSSRSIDVYLR